MLEIKSKITEFAIVDPTLTEDVKKVPVQMNENIKRPVSLKGTTYKISPGTQDSSIYITINDYMLENGELVPYEIFLNSRDSNSAQWVSALTIMLSAMFRKGGSISFLIDGLKGIHDPKGGYFKKSQYMSSVVTELAMVVEDHLKTLSNKNTGTKSLIHDDDIEYPDNATVCPKCHAKAMIMSSSCETCLACNYSKCG